MQNNNMFKEQIDIVSSVNIIKSSDSGEIGTILKTLCERIIKFNEKPYNEQIQIFINYFKDPTHKKECETFIRRHPNSWLKDYILR